MGANGVTSGGSIPIQKPPGRSLLLPGVYRTTPQTVPWQPYSPHLPSCLSQEPPTPRAPSRRAPPDTSARPTISPVSRPPSLAQPTAGEGRGEEGRSGAGREGQRMGAVNVVKEVATVLGEARWGPKPGQSLD